MKNNSKLRFSNLWNGRPSRDVSASASYEIDIRLNLETSDLVVLVDAPFFDDPFPLESYRGFRCDQLSHYEVVGIVIAPGDLESNPEKYYLEILLGPYGHYFVCTYPFEGAMCGKNSGIILEKLPVNRIDHAKRRWRGEIYIPCHLLPEPKPGDDDLENISSTWMMNAFAIHRQQKEPEHLTYSPSHTDSAPNSCQMRLVPVTVSESYSDFTSDETTEAMSEMSELRPTDFMRESSQKSGLSSSNKSAAELSPTNRSDSPKRRDSNIFTPDRNRRNSVILNMDQICMDLKEKYGLPDINESYKRHLIDDEFVVLYGPIVKRTGWSYKRRMLILTSKPRLLYLNMTSSPSVKGQITWTMTKPITIIKIDHTHFHIKQFDDARVFFMNDQLGCDRWIDCVSVLNSTWSEYLKTTLGNKFDLKVLADSLNSPA